MECIVNDLFSKEKVKRLLTERKQNYSQMLHPELYLAYYAAILILVTDQTPGPNTSCEFDFVDSFTHEINEN